MLRLATNQEPPRLWTLGRVAERLEQPQHRIAYIVRSRQIKPTAYAGNLRLFNRQAIEQIAAALDEMERRSARGLR